MKTFERPKPFEREGADDQGFVVGGEVVTPTAISSDDPRGPEGHIVEDAARERGWLAAITRAHGSELPATQRRRNVQEIVDAAREAGISKEIIRTHLESLGITVVSAETTTRG